MNVVILHGNIANDIDMRHSQSGVVYGTLSLAVNEWSNKEKKTYFIRVAVVGKTAEYVEQNLEKGCAVIIEGRLQVKKYTDKTGNPREWVEVFCDRLSAITRKKTQDIKYYPRSGETQSHYDGCNNKPDTVHSDEFDKNDPFNDFVPF